MTYIYKHRRDDGRVVECRVYTPQRQNENGQWETLGEWIERHKVAINASISEWPANVDE